MKKIPVEGKGIFVFFLICNLLFFLLLFVDLICFPQVATIPSAGFWKLTQKEVTAYMQSSSAFEGVIRFSEIVGLAGVIIDMIGLHILLYARLY